MGSHRYTRHASAAPGDVFRALTDPSLVVDWMDARSIVGTTGPLDAHGSEYTLVIRGPWRFRMAVVHPEPGSRYELDATGPLGARYGMVVTLAANPEGGTDVGIETRWTLPLGPVGRWVDQRWVDPGPHTAANREFDRLVELATQPAAQPATA